MTYVVLLFVMCRTSRGEQVLHGGREPGVPWPSPFTASPQSQLILNQSVPRRCRLLIAEVNANHELRTPDALARNVPLIRELNGNVSRVRPCQWQHCLGPQNGINIVTFCYGEEQLL